MNTLNNERIKSKLQKILALARAGVGGEKENATRMLDKLLGKYNITVDELDDSSAPITKCLFLYKNASEKTLLTQCCYYVIDGKRALEGVRYKGLRGKVFILLTQAEYIEVDLMYSLHRKALAKHLKTQANVALLAYIHTNNIFGAELDDSSPKRRPKSLSEADTAAIIAMMRGMEPTPIHKQISHNTMRAA